MPYPGSFGVVFVQIIVLTWGNMAPTVLLFVSAASNVLFELNHHPCKASAGFVYVLISPVTTSSHSAFSTECSHEADDLLLVFWALPLSTLPSNRSTFFLFPSNTQSPSSSLHLQPWQTVGEKMRALSLPSHVLRSECLCALACGRLFSLVSHSSFTFTLARMQLYWRLPCVSFSFEPLNAHKAVT